MNPATNVLPFPGNRSKPTEPDAEQVLVDVLMQAHDLSAADARCVARRFMGAAAPLWGQSVPVALPDLRELAPAVREAIACALDEVATQLRDLFLAQLLSYELWLWRMGSDGPGGDEPRRSA